MIIVIQCAAGKRPGAGHFVSPSGKPVVFVAKPLLAPADPAREYARPDDLSLTGLSWRNVLLSYNETEKTDNRLRLYPAYKLYANQIYERLVERFGLRHVYILSAGWGLIAADFLTPYYDITFTRMAEAHKRRRATDLYDDFHMLPDDTTDDVLFFGGHDYLPLFSSLTESVRGRRTVFYNSELGPRLPGCTLRRFETNRRTNWHYECANAFLAGAITTD
jgi:hypothetical protein